MIRLKNISLIVSVLFCIIALRLWYMQIIKGDYYYNLSENNRIRLIPVSPVRGRILDTNGVVLVDSRPSFQVGIFESELNKKEKKEVLETLSNLLNVPCSKLADSLRKADTPPFVPKVILRDISRQEAITLETRISNLPGVMIQAIPLRHYPFGRAGAHLLGYLGLVNRFELKELNPKRKELRRLEPYYGFQPKDVVGRAGVEKKFDEHLRGQPGGQQVEVDRRGSLIKVLSQRNQVKGEDLQISIDIRIQQKAEQLLGKGKGVIIVMNPNTGEIIALTSHPAYDPTVFVDPDLRPERNKLFINKGKPLINRALSGTYPPGSIFKIVIAAAGLEKKKIARYTPFTCPGYKVVGRRKFNCWKKAGHGDVNVCQSLAESCNTFFYTTGLRLGPDEIARFARSFGLGRVSGLGLSGEKKGLIPDRRWKKTALKQTWYQGETANYSIGQGYITLTPIQALGMISTIANNGNLVKPTLLKGAKPVLEKINISKNNIKIIKTGLADTIRREGGTAHFAQIKGLPYSGKTGTAQASGNKKHGWFVGYAPSNKPEISFVILLENTLRGGREAAQVARDLLKFWKSTL